MKQDFVLKNFRQYLVVCGICIVFVCVGTTPASGIISQNHNVISTSHIVSQGINEGDIPTWSLGDAWTYTIDPLSFSNANGSFSGSIENFQQTVVGMVEDTYAIAITGDITGDITVDGFSGELSGDISGTSQVRVSDLAEHTTELHSQGTITYMWIPFAYEMNLYTSSSPALEIYDFPLHIEEQWQLGSLTTLTGTFTIEGVYDQSFNESQWIEETIACTQQESITVPAGTFACYKIERSATQSWYSTEVGNMVKSVINQSGENMTLHAVITLESSVDADQPITLTQEISPAVVAPGAPVSISGYATFTSSGAPIQSGDISLEIPSAGVSSSTTTNSAGYYSITLDAPTMNDDTPVNRETGSGGIIVRCSYGGLSGYHVRTLTTVQDTPPSVPSIQGPTEGKPRIAYSYTIVATDSEGDGLFYYMDWGDTTSSNWVGPYPANETVTLTHTYTKKGSFTIKVQARDIYYAVSPWGTLEVTMPTEVSLPFFLKFLYRFPLLFTLLQQLRCYKQLR
jgi:hypothetical protein